MSPISQGLPPLPETDNYKHVNGACRAVFTSAEMQRYAKDYSDARDIELAGTLAKASMQIYALKRELRNCVGFMEHVAMECGEGDTPKNFALAISRAHEVLK